MTFEVLHTPGHTPEHVSLLVHDRAQAGARPLLKVVRRRSDNHRSRFEVDPTDLFR